jgi:hypothetical protein
MISSQAENCSAISSVYNPVTEAIRDRLYCELTTMAEVLNSPITRPPFSQILLSLDTLLDEAADLLNAGEIDPFTAIRTSPEQQAQKFTDARLRIGFYPISANPFHWGHLLIGLSALTRLRLDSVVYIISGDDPRKPSLVSPESRHRLGKKILSLFAPLFRYSAIALGNNLDGETNIFNILALNPQQKIDAFYIVGSDHYHRVNPGTGDPDTIQKLEDNMRNRLSGVDGTRHCVSALFIKRGNIPCRVATSLAVSFIPALPFNASSTMIRNAFLGREPLDTLALLPYTAFKSAGAFQSSGHFFMPVDRISRALRKAEPTLLLPAREV